MIDILNLALPFFGLIFLGVAFGKLKKIPDSGLAWMDFFVVYVALPAMFYRIMATTPLEQLTQVRFIVATTASSFLCFAIAFAIGYWASRRDLARATITGLAGAYGNIGYMGPGLTLSTFGPGAAAPVALILCFDTLLWFSLAPLLMELSGADKKKSIGRALLDVLRSIVTHPFLVASALGVASAALHLHLPVALDRLLAFLQSAAAPCALFALGVTVALRPLTRLPWELPFVAFVKLAVHPALLFGMLTLLGPFDPVWVATAVLLAALPTALNVFVMARQYEAWVEEASAAVLLGTIASVITVTTVMWLVRHQQTPLPPFQ